MAYKSQKVLKAEYKKARRNLQQNVRRLAKRGYDVSDIVIPEIPEGKMKQSYINQLNKLNTQRYELSSKIELVKHRDITGEYVETLERVSGKRARGFERRRVGAKISAELKRTSKLTPSARDDYKYLKKVQKEDNAWNTYIDPQYFLDEYESNLARGEMYGRDWRLDDEGMDYYYRVGEKWFHGESEEYYQAREHKGDPYFDTSEGKVFDPSEGEYLEPTDVDFDQYSYYMDTETGEIVERPKGAKRPKVEGAEFVRIMSTEDAGKLAYKRAIEELNIMSSYMGDPKHGKNTKHDERVRANADQIKAKLEALHSENPGAVERALAYTDTNGDFHSVDYMYRAGGYGAYLYYFEALLESLGADMDYESEEDYDEGNFEY